MLPTETEALANILQQIHEYSRHEVGLHVAWFSFFLTLLMGALGWSLKEVFDRRGQIRYPLPFYCMLLLFTIQLAVSIIGTSFVRRDLRLAQEHATAIQAHLLPSVYGGLATPLTPETLDPSPRGVQATILFMQLTLVSHLIFWVVLGLFIRKRQRASRK